MKKNDVFTFTAPNGVEVTGIVVAVRKHSSPSWNHRFEYLCYAQNRLFLAENEVLDVANYSRTNRPEYRDHTPIEYKETIVDYAILPDYDAMLEDEQQQFDEDCYEALSSIGDVEF